jgi:hypothetical protein
MHGIKVSPIQRRNDNGQACIEVVEAVAAGDNQFFMQFGADHDTWRDYLTAAGFLQVRHYSRPPGLPRHKQWWLATVWRKG